MESSREMKRRWLVSADPKVVGELLNGEWKVLLDKADTMMYMNDMIDL